MFTDMNELVLCGGGGIGYCWVIPFSKSKETQLFSSFLSLIFFVLIGFFNFDKVYSH